MTLLYSYVWVSLGHSRATGGSIAGIWSSSQAALGWQPAKFGLLYATTASAPPSPLWRVGGPDVEARGPHGPHRHGQASDHPTRTAVAGRDMWGWGEGWHRQQASPHPLTSLPLLCASVQDLKTRLLLLIVWPAFPFCRTFEVLIWVRFAWFIELCIYARYELKKQSYLRTRCRQLVFKMVLLIVLPKEVVSIWAHLYNGFICMPPDLPPIVSREGPDLGRWGGGAGYKGPFTMGHTRPQLCAASPAPAISIPLSAVLLESDGQCRPVSADRGCGWQKFGPPTAGGGHLTASDDQPMPFDSDQQSVVGQGGKRRLGRGAGGRARAVVRRGVLDLEASYIRLTSVLHPSYIRLTSVLHASYMRLTCVLHPS